MPLPKKLKRNASEKKKREVVNETMHELTHDPVNAPSRKATSGVQRRKQDIAISLKQAGLARKGGRRKKK